MLKATLTLCSAALLAGMFTPAGAQGYRERERFHERERIERHEVRRDLWWGDIHRFREHDFALWRGGYWLHDRHDGRFGWWWVVGGAWYFYPAPIYPYPDPYIPPGVVVGPNARNAWFYCGNPQGYYPYVSACAMPWRRVAAETTYIEQPAPPGPPPGPSGPPPGPPGPPPEPPMVNAVPPAPGGSDWYYCGNPSGYYPSVQQCPGGWRRVPAAAPPP